MEAKHLAGFREYLNAGYEHSVFEQALAGQELRECHAHSPRRRSGYCRSLDGET